MNHVCPVSDCTHALHREVLMCAHHWLMVPKAIRRAVCTSWHSASRIVAPRDEVRRRHQVWREARAAAIAAVESQMEPA